MISRALLAAVLSGLFPLRTPAQNAASILGDTSVDPVMQHSLLPYAGVPFHALLHVAREGETAQTGSVEVWWADPAHLRVVLTSPSFTQQTTISGDLLEQTHSGSYLPRWLEMSQHALLDPVPVILRVHRPLPENSSNTFGGLHTVRCISRDDRPGGITDQMTWGRLCLDEAGTHVGQVLTFTNNIVFSDWQSFGTQEIARQYKLYLRGSQPVVATLTTLETLSETDQASLRLANAKPSKDGLSTMFVSTAKAESLLETAPIIAWPPVHEGKTEGYMIVYARTDRTGQVREASPFNADNPGLEDFGAQQALQYKFKPLLVDGLPSQMETPLVLHFSTRIEDPIPVFSVAEMNQQTIRCHPDPVPPGVLSSGQHAVVRVSVDEHGSIVGTQPSSTAPWNRLLTSWMSIKKSCSFKPFLVNGKPTFYKGDVELPR